jgi:hypothetical protein
MPEVACLHIQTRESDPVRVVELPGASIRIGRASYCEVRLAEPELAEEECRLRRKGGSWQLVPARRNGAVSINGESVDEACSLPFDLPFKVGEHWLTLRSTDVSSSEWRPYRASSRMEGSASVLEEFRQKTRERGTETAATPRAAEPARDAGNRAGIDHLERWRERQDQRTKRHKPVRDERSWEERWKAAGEQIRARSAAPPSPPVASAPTSPPSSGLRAEPIARPSTARLEPGIDSTIARASRQTYPRVPGILDIGPAKSRPPEPTNVEHAETPFEETRATVSAETATIDERLSAPSDHSTPEPISQFEARNRAPGEFNSPAGTPANDPLVAFVPRPTSIVPAHEPDFEPEPERFDDRLATQDAVPDEPPDAEPAGQTAELDALMLNVDVVPDDTATGDDHRPEIEVDVQESTVHENVATRDAASPAAEKTSGDPRDVTPPPGAERLAATVREAPRNGPRAFVADTRQAPTSGAGDPNPQHDFSTTVHDAHGPTARAVPPGRTSTIAFDDAKEHFRTRDRAEPKPRPGPPPAAETAPSWLPPFTADPQQNPSARDWPKASEIFAAHRTCPKSQPTPKPANRGGVQAPSPTELREPSSWQPPLWLTWPVAMAATMALAAGGISLAWAWSADAYSAGVVASRLAGRDAGNEPLPKGVVTPDGSWWKSTASNLMVWALYHDRASVNDASHAEQVGPLLDAAAKAAPMQAQVRFAKARHATSTSQSSNLLDGLGLSRDVVALAWSGRRWREADKKDVALKVYRKALEMASSAKLEHFAPPAFDDDPRVRHYLLPGEDLLSPIIADLVEDSGWTFEQWSSALPNYALVPLVAARQLIGRGSPDAEKALDAAIAAGDGPAPEGMSAAIHLAARAEALFLRSRWVEAEETYQRAIGLAPPDAIRRCWWFNVAEIAARLNDEIKRQTALEAARATPVNDEVAKRALEQLKLNGARFNKPNTER